MFTDPFPASGTESGTESACSICALSAQMVPVCSFLWSTRESKCSTIKLARPDGVDVIFENFVEIIAKS